MSIYLGPLYHWSPVANRAGIRKRGLRPTTLTAIAQRPTPPHVRGHYVEDLEPVELKAVCLGTSPALAWALSGVWDATPGAVFDLWEVNLVDTDEVHVVPEYGQRMDEVRVIGPIPRGRVWHVGERTVGRLRWYTVP